jgi:cyclic-di-GMP-binding protein
MPTEYQAGETPAGTPGRRKNTMPSFLPTQQPVVADAKSCEAWLARATLADPKQACHELTGLLEALEDVSPSEGAYLEILERLREPIIIAQAEHGKKFAARPLPLKEYEISAFEQVYDLWATLGRAFRRLLRAAIEDGSPDLAGKEALLAQRALDCVGELMLVHYRARREVDSELWQDLHQVYQTAEQAGVVMTTVSAGHGSKSVSTCTEVYVRALLLALANPYGLAARELAWTRRWATMWAYKVDLVAAAADAQGYAVDLAYNQPPIWIKAETAKPTVRFLETTNLRRSVRSRVKKLESGVEPQTLGLGKDCVQPEVGRLLVSLGRAWIESPAQRQFTRRLVTGRTELTSGLESIHLALSGKAFRSAARHWDYTRRDAEQIYIYQGVSPAAAAEDTTSGFSAEKWETLDESANGFRLRRKGGGERLALGQLVGLKPDGARSFILCEVRWLMTGIDGSLTIGASALPGLGAAVAVRPASMPNNAPEAFTQAFLLPNAAAQPSSLLLPSGWYQHGRELEMREEADVKRVKLLGVVHRGYDYDRANFSVAGPGPVAA